MRLVHQALAWIAMGGVGHALVSCGRTELNPGAVSSGGTAAGHAGALPGGSGGTSLLPQRLPCDPLDARSSGASCWLSSGYTWNGSACEEMMCSCVGTDCSRLFATIGACDSAYSACYAESGIDRTCTKHSDCTQESRTCCPSCTYPDASQLFALNRNSPTLRETGACLGPEGPCGTCFLDTSATVYPSCIDGICQMLDVTDQATCQADADCRLTSKDCCDCGGDFSAHGLMAVSNGYTHGPRCEGVGCDGCVPSDPVGIHATCDLEKEDYEMAGTPVNICRLVIMQ